MNMQMMTRVVGTGLAIFLAMGCASVPAADSNDAVQEVASLPAVASAGDELEPIVAVEHEQVVDVPMPEDCAFKGEDPMVWELNCPEVNVNLSRVAMMNNEDVPHEFAMEGFVRAMSDQGWQVKGQGTRDIVYGEGGATLNRFRVTHGEESADVYASLLPTIDGRTLRMFSCMVPEGANPDDLGCSEHLVTLMTYAEAHRITGLRIKGRSVAIPKTCEIGDRSIRCGRDVVNWMEFPGDTPVEELVSIERYVLDALIEKKASIERRQITCDFIGAPMTCSATIFELPGYRKQGLVFAYSELDGRRIRFVCDIVDLPDPAAMSEACSLFFNATIGGPLK